MSYFELYCETAIGGLNNRNVVIPVKDFRLNGLRNECYRSVFLFGPELKTWVDKTDSVTEFTGPHTADAVPFDFDGENLSAVKAEVEKFIGYLTETYEIPLDYFRLSFSGNKGFHVVIPIEAFVSDPKPSIHFAQIVKAIAGEMSQGFSFVDSSIYESKRLLRVLNTVNLKSGLHKIPLTFSELQSLTVDEIKELAKEPREIEALATSEISPVESLSALWAKWYSHDFRERKKTERHDSDIFQLLRGAEQGSRNDAAIKLAGTYLAAGLNESLTLATLEAWNKQNNPPLPQGELEGVVHGAFQRYKKESTEAVRVYDLRDAGKVYAEFIGSMKKAKAHTGFETVDKKLRGIMPGESLCVLGKTSVGKSAFLQNAGINYAKSSGRPVLFFSMEMPITSVFERAAQIEFELSGYEIENDLTRNTGDIQGFAEMLFSKIPNFYCIEKNGLTLEAIESLVRYAEENVYHDKTGLVLIDYLGLVKSSGKDIYEQVSKVARGMKDLAKSLGVPIIFLSQVNRNYSAFEELQIDAARDSGAVDEASDFILGLWREQVGSEDDTSPEMRLKLGILKNRRGGLGKITVEMERRTLRMKEVDGQI
ncbi:MAG: primase C-terminal domain-containing protein [Bacteroidetes bacterium]|nr:primase C-terminal domain-containing protein [Bacteroidota bacterium]MCL5739227.1 primase C-terminal domain-containing protein [Bacteroidota bacterium]